MIRSRRFPSQPRRGRPCRSEAISAAPPASGPRWRIVSLIASMTPRWTAASGGPTKPQIPHTWRNLARSAGRAPRGDLPVGSFGEEPTVEAVDVDQKPRVRIALAYVLTGLLPQRRSQLRRNGQPSDCLGERRLVFSRNEQS